jgi:hypothetical protein
LWVRKWGSTIMNEASVEASLNGKPTTFFLKRGTTKIAATVSYTKTATGVFKAVMRSTKPLVSGATYTATVAISAKDLAGNALDQNKLQPGSQPKTWTFTVS